MEAVRLALAPVSVLAPFLGPMTQLVTVIWGNAENVKFNRIRAKRLAERSQQVVDSLFAMYNRVEGKDQMKISDHVIKQVGNLLNLLKEIDTFLEKLGNQGVVKRLISNQTIEVHLETLSASLLSASQTLQLSISTDSLVWQQQDKEDKQKDMVAIQEYLDALMGNSQRILDTLEIKQNQIMEAMEGLQKAISHSVSSSVEKKLMQTVLSNLGRISNGNTPKVHPWTITSWEIEIGEPIAQGGYGEVCIGTWMGHTKVAVKRLLSRLDTEKSTKEFIKEVEIWHRLKHPYILQLFGACSTADKPFMVCPFMSNGHMLQYLEKHPSEGTRLLYETSQGMQYLHNTNIIHGDLKAVNILVDDSGHAKITDFGFAVVKATHYSKSSSSKVVAGTLRWSAPECLKGDKPSFQSDVYAFGITAFEVGSGGSIPFDHLADAGFRELILEGTRPKRPEECSLGLYQLMERCWAPKPDDRPTFDSVSTSLKLLLQMEISNATMNAEVEGLKKLHISDGESSRGDSASGRSVNSTENQINLVDQIQIPQQQTIPVAPPRSSSTRYMSAPIQNTVESKQLPHIPIVASTSVPNSVPERKSSINRIQKAYTNTAPSLLGAVAPSPSVPVCANGQPKSGDSGYQSHLNMSLPSTHFNSASTINLHNSAAYSPAPNAGQSLPNGNHNPYSYPQSQHIPNQYYNSQVSAHNHPQLSYTSSVSPYSSTSNVNPSNPFDPALIPEYTRLFESSDPKIASVYANKLGEIYFYIADYSAAYNWFVKSVEKASTKGTPGAEAGDAMLHLGECFYYGYGTSKNIPESVKWFRHSADLGNPLAQNYLGHCYYKGISVSVDLKQAHKYIKKAVDQRLATAEYNLALLHLRGEGVKPDYPKAFALLLKSSTSLDLSLYYLGWMYYQTNLKGVTSDRTKAIECWITSVDRDNCLWSCVSLYLHYEKIGMMDEAKRWRERADILGSLNGNQGEERFGINIVTGLSLTT